MRYVVTGGSGYIGTRLVERLLAREDTERVVICDIRPPRAYRPKTEFQHLDVRDRDRATDILKREQPDALVHLAFVLNPMHDERAMYDIDVNGCQNVLEAASEAGTSQVLVTSSTTAYGAFADNPVPLTEEDPVRGVANFEYARDKSESDRLCQLWALRHPERTMTIVRPCIVFGPTVDNYIVRLWTKQPFQADFGGADPPFQLVHEDDLVEAVVGLLDGRHAGAFNVTGDGLMTLRECADMIGLKRRRVHEGAYRKFAGLMWNLRLAETPAGNIDFAIHPWVASNEKVKETLGWTPRHSTRETFEITMRTRGVLGGEEPAGLPQVGVPVGA